MTTYRIVDLGDPLDDGFVVRADNGGDAALLALESLGYGVRVPSGTRSRSAKRGSAQSDSETGEQNHE